jgi:hypothetical protein
VEQTIVDPTREGTSLSGVICSECLLPITDRVAIRTLDNGQRTHRHNYQCKPDPERMCATGVAEGWYPS